ncbi:triose-phosphate isomerase [Mycoplasma sp. 4423]
MKRKLIIGNWKMNKTYSESKEFFEKFGDWYFSNNELLPKNIEFGIAVPAANLCSFVVNTVEKFRLAAQDCSPYESGAYTGDTSASMLIDLDVSYVILGHSERRKYHFETDELVNVKAKQVISYHLKPIICVGETFEQYQAGQTKEVIKKQLEVSLKDLDLKKVVIAYEPIWAIGTGKVATPEIAQDICKYIHEITSKDVVVQYGGSVTPSNIAELSKQPDINGFLVGGASLELKSFIDLLKNTK